MNTVYVTPVLPNRAVRHHHSPTAPQQMLVPKIVQVETVATACTARCTMCPIESWTRPVEVMKLELFSRILDQLAPTGQTSLMSC